jgi:acyl-[acyl-carrier-protein]-phospholipid O-acyltransferase/long-chain-fatty-acid--[acyl-carrier-protein] ligase
MEDIERSPLTYSQMITRTLVLGRAITRNTVKGENVGVLLPNMSSTIITFFALQATDRVPAMLNFSTGQKTLLSACKTAQLKTVYTSKKFVETGKLEDMISAMTEDGVSVIYLEDLRQTISTGDKLAGWLSGKFPRLAYRFSHPDKNADQPAVVLFTSGSEGTPKGVVLTHANILANCHQLISRLDLRAQDIVFSALPVFHSFGLTGGTLLPILTGIRTFFYPSPLHYRTVPELVYDTNATLMFGTDTFLSGYAKYAHAYDFFNLRFVFAGAEKLKDSTRKIWAEKFGVRILEGYGTTETGPALAINTPMQNKPGSVGRLLPGIQHRLEPVPGIESGGRLIVSGPNIMAGYLFADQPGKLNPPENGWYDTGDIVEIDDRGFITIKGRAKRFAKIAGEMISLTAVEEYVSNLWPEHASAVVSIPDEKKGEQLILVTSNPEAERQQVLQYAKGKGLGDLSIPKKILIVDKLPLLGTGKTDYPGIMELVKENAEMPPQAI